MTDKLVFSSMRDLLKSSPLPPQQGNGSLLLEQYLSMSKDKRLPVLSRKKWELACVPQVVLERDMYKPSRIVRSIQYVFEQNVVRVWKDEVFSMEGSGKLIEMNEMTDNRL